MSDARPRLEEPMAGPASAARIFDAFLLASRTQPDAVAIAHPGGRWTYAQLERASRAFAAQLLAQPASNPVVGLYARRSPELVVGMLGCLRAGLTFAVLDAAYPIERLAQLLEVARPARVATCALTMEDAQVLARLKLPGPPIVLRAELDADAALSDAVAAESIAYLLFTSGTTGVPKCIQTRHHPLVHFVDWYAQAFTVDAGCRFSMLSGLGHDPVLRDILVPLSRGATLHIPAPGALLDPPKLHAWMLGEQITHAHATPQLCRLLVAGHRDAGPLSSLRFVFSGGDVLRRKLVGELQEVAPAVQVVNFYGATETPQAMGFHRFDAALDGGLEVIPIGRGIADVQLLVLDEQLRLAEVGARGQIAIRTRFLSAGYFNDAGLNTTKFIPNPLGKDADDGLYLTGDVGVFREDGAVVAQGRLDDQVKVRGFRVELGDVVHHLEKLAGVSAAVVLPELSPDGETRLIAYLIGTGDSNAVRAALSAALPSYMLPFQSVWLERFPLLPNGKLDRAALASLRPAAQEESIADPTEAAIVAHWKTLLGLEAISVEFSFVELGGDSLSFIRAGMMLQEVLGALPEGWDKLSIRKLARQRHATRSWLTRVDSTVLLRALSIIAIVADHLGFPNLEGSVRTLFVISGMSFGKYMATSVLRTNKVTAILRLALRIALPTVLYTELLNVAFARFRPGALLLLTNFTGPDFEAGGFHFWFINVLVQSQLILAALLAVKPIRALLRRAPFGLPLAASFAFALVAYAAPWVWDTAPLYDHVPHHYLGAMLLGWAAVQADTAQRKAWVALATVATFIEPALRSAGVLVLPFAATFVLVAVRQVSLPLVLGRAVNQIAGASLFIYLTDHQVAKFAAKTPLARAPAVTLALAVLVGIAAWKLWEAVTATVLRWIRRTRGSSSVLDAPAAAE